MKTQVAFSFDTTGSMIDYLDRVRRDLDSIITRLFKNVPDIEIGMVAHGDYCDTGKVTLYEDFCSERHAGRLRTFMGGVTRTSGGDMPECYELVLHEAQTKFSWAPGCYGSLVMIGDAIPHEPNDRGNESHLDWKAEVQRLHEGMGVRVYTVQCPPEDDVPGADDFWQELAERGGGIHLSISVIGEIVEVLVAICMREANSVELYEAPEADKEPVAAVMDLLQSVSSSGSRPVVRQVRTDMADTDTESQRSIDPRNQLSSTSVLDSTQPLELPRQPREPVMASPGFGDYDYDSTPEPVVKPWRDIKLKWDEEEYRTKREYIASRSPLLDESHTYKILLCGAIRAGKSSVINTVVSALRDEIGQIAFNADDDKSITRKFRIYRLRESVKKRAIRVTLCDTMGFEQQDLIAGPSIRDFEYIMDGHIMDGYEFKPNDSIGFNSEHFKKNPGPMDKVHALVLVVDASSAQTMSKEVIEKLKEVTSKANERDIRWAVVMTKIDQACEDVDRDLCSVFTSDTMSNCVESIHEHFGVITSNIFPMQNYGSQVQVSQPMNILALHTLENILRLADNTLEAQAGNLPADRELPAKMDLLDSPWRTADFTTERVETMWSELVDVDPDPDNVDRMRICFMGPSGSGKSAFINSCMSEFYQRIVTFAETGRGGAPMTTHYREYLLKQGRDGAELAIELIDTMGFMAGAGGILNEDVATVLDGKATNTSGFNPAVPLNRTDSPTSLADRMHLLVLVVNGAEFAGYAKELIDKMKAAMDTAKGQSREIPRVVLVTHIDHVCEHVAADPSNVFLSLQVKECLDMVHQKLQIPLVDIQPVCNYHNDTEVDQRKSALVLQALDHHVERAQDYIAAAPGGPPAGAGAKKKGWFW